MTDQSRKRKVAAMALRVAILPHADLPHILPCFRIGRELLKWGHDVRILGSDVHTLGRKHSDAWADQLARFGLRGREIVHRSPDMTFFDWFIQQLRELRLDVLILDAVWQGLAFTCHNSSLVKTIIVHSAGLPEFRYTDMPTWRFAHPGHGREHWAETRRSIAELDQTAGEFRGMISSIRAQSGAGGAGPEAFAFGCIDFATLPAIRAMSLCPAAEFPDERGRVDYFGTLLPGPADPDWKPPPSELADDSRALIACVFGTTALVRKEQYEWLSSTAKSLAHSFPECQVVVVVPDPLKPQDLTDRPKDLLCYPWIPLWEVLSTRTSAKVLLSPPGVGAFREAVASGTPVVAIPRRLDQFGAAARVEYFKVGSVVISRALPAPDLVAQVVGHVLQSEEIQVQSRRLRQEVLAFDATLPLKRFMENPSPGASHLT